MADYQIFLTFLSLGLSIAVLFFIIWDHIKDDRILFREVQQFYEDIEMLIFTHIQIRYYKALGTDDKSNANKDLTAFVKNKNRDNIQNNYLKTKISQHFMDFSKYLGLSFNIENENYLNGTVFILNKDGLLSKRNIEEYKDIPIITNYTEISKTQIDDIFNFLNSLRFFWKKWYYKSIFRPELKQRVNFYDLLGYIKPIELVKQRKKFLRYRRNS
ncbi:MAG: hypothetical protein ACFE8L_01800 [Candidatus Hodarchaeota archaeon]